MEPEKVKVTINLGKKDHELEVPLSELNNDIPTLLLIHKLDDIGNLLDTLICDLNRNMYKTNGLLESIRNRLDSS